MGKYKEKLSFGKESQESSSLFHFHIDKQAFYMLFFILVTGSSWRSLFERCIVRHHAERPGNAPTRFVCNKTFTADCAVEVCFFARNQIKFLLLGGLFYDVFTVTYWFCSIDQRR